MGFPDIRSFPKKSGSGPYDRQMVRQIADLLRVFAGRIPDTESHEHVLELAVTPEHWSAGHAVFKEVRSRLHRASNRAQELQYHFEESCCKAIYNATYPNDEFDSCSPFFVVGEALQLALELGIPLEHIAAVFAPPGEKH